MLADDRQHLVDRAFEVVVDHHMIGDGQAHGFFIERLAQPLVDLVLGVATAAKATLLLVA